MIRNTPLLAILLIFLILNVFYFTPRVPQSDHVYNRFKYAFTGEEKDRDNAASSFIDDLTSVVGLGNTGNLGAGGAGAGDKPLENANVHEHQGNLQDEVITLQNIAEGLGVKQAGLGKAIGEQTPPPASAQAKLTPNNDDDPQSIEADKSKLELPLNAQSEDSTPENSAQHPTDENASKDADANLAKTSPSTVPSSPAAEAEKQLESSPKAEVAPSQGLNEDPPSATTVPGMDVMMRVRKL